MSFISILIGSLVAGSFLSLTNFGLASAADTSPQFTVSECPVVSSGTEERSGQCPDMKTIENDGNRIGNEQSNTSAPDEHVVENEQSVTSTAITSGPVNPFG